MTTVTVTFDRIGRTRPTPPKPLVIDAADVLTDVTTETGLDGRISVAEDAMDWNELIRRIEQHANRNGIASRAGCEALVQSNADGTEINGTLIVGMGRPAGEFTVEVK